MSNPSKDTEVRQPKLQSYCAALYSAFESTATVEEADGVQLTVWRGKLTQTTKDVGIPAGVYKRVMDQLHELECIEQIEAGRGGWPTTIVLLRAPTVELWRDEISVKGLTKRDGAAILSRRLSDLERRFPEGFDFIKALTELQSQLDDLNEKFDNYVKEVQSKNQ